MINNITAQLDVVNTFTDIFGYNESSFIGYDPNTDLSASFPTGFKKILDYDISQSSDPTDPTDYNRRRILIGHFNRIAELSSLQLYHKQCGGIRTFNLDFCNMIGGYPKGIILEAFDGTYFRQVMSLKENNTVSFLSGETIYNIPLIDNSKIDNENWMFCDYNNRNFIPWQIDKESTPFVIVNENYTTASRTYTGNYIATNKILVVPEIIYLSPNTGQEDPARNIYINITYTIDGVSTFCENKIDLGALNNGRIGVTKYMTNWEFMRQPHELNSGDSISWNVHTSRKGGTHRIKLMGYELKQF